MALLSRRMLILVAALLVLGARYACEPAPVAGDPTLIADLGHLTRTAAAGHALQIQPGVSVNKAGYDLGMFFYPSVALSVFPRWLAADLTLWPKLQLAVFAVACARAWPKNALVRGRGGWLTVSFQGARFQKYQLRIPPLSKGDDALWMLPVLPGTPPSLVTISLREMGEPVHDPGVHLGDVLDLVRAPGF